ncbi:MAG: hypothetical protein ACLQJR_14905, partial [Stellaceae bacterium]
MVISSSRPTSGVSWRALERRPPPLARPDEPKQSGWLGHALERVRAALFDDKESRDLALYLRGDQ